MDGDGQNDPADIVKLYQAMAHSPDSMLLVAGARYRTYQSGLLIPRTWTVSILGATLSFTRLMVMGVAVLLMLGLHYLVRKTWLGRAMRAVAQDREAAAMMGVDVDRALETLRQIPLSLHCWQGDDVGGFESPDAELGGGLAATGNYPGKARSVDSRRARARRSP